MDTPLFRSFAVRVLGNGELSVHEWLETYLGSELPHEVYKRLASPPNGYEQFARFRKVDDGLVSPHKVGQAIEQVALACAWRHTWPAVEQRLIQLSPVSASTADRIAARKTWEKHRRGMGAAGDQLIEAK